jgi:hypothetical protein
MKTPGTHTDDDASQQPRQTTKPTKREESAIDKEDHTRTREKLVNEKRASKNQRGTEPK